MAEQLKPTTVTTGASMMTRRHTGRNSRCGKGNGAASTGAGQRNHRCVERPARRPANT